MDQATIDYSVEDLSGLQIWKISTGSRMFFYWKGFGHQWKCKPRKTFSLRIFIDASCMDYEDLPQPNWLSSHNFFFFLNLWFWLKRYVFLVDIGYIDLHYCMKLEYIGQRIYVMRLNLMYFKHGYLEGIWSHSRHQYIRENCLMALIYIVEN